MYTGLGRVSVGDVVVRRVQVRDGTLLSLFLRSGRILSRQQKVEVETAVGASIFFRVMNRHALRDWIFLLLCVVASCSRSDISEPQILRRFRTHLISLVRLARQSNRRSGGLSLPS